LAARKKLLSGQLLGHEDLLHTGEDPQVVKVLYMAHCTREKGLFDTLAGVGLAREGLKAAHSPLSVRVLVTGNFVTAQEKEEFEELLAQPDAAQTMEYLGFVSGEQKNKMLREADIFCFPTYYQNENQPVNLIEAVAFGLPILTTRWRSIPELFPRDYPGLVEVRSPIQIAAAILKLLSGESGEGFRDLFLGNFTLERHISGLAEAFRQLERTEPGQVAEPMPARAS
jgi:glycosyltransferase involved in cell wall biosynthesis